MTHKPMRKVDYRLLADAIRRMTFPAPEDHQEIIREWTATSIGRALSKFKNFDFKTFTLACKPTPEGEIAYKVSAEPKTVFGFKQGRFVG